jgi:hypothetical protein
MPTPLQTDVQALTLRLLANVREAFWYGSSIEENCTRIELTPGHGNTVNIPVVNSFYVESIPDGVRMDQMQTIQASDIQITTGLVGGQFVLNKSAMYNARDDLMQLITSRITGEFKKKRAQDLLSLANLWTAPTICGANSTLTYGHLLAAETQLLTHPDRKAPQGSKTTIAVHSRALYPVLRNLGGIGTGGSFIAPIPQGMSQDVLEGSRRLDRPKPILTLMGGTRVYGENYIKIDATNNMVGMAFFQDGIIYVPAVDLEETIHDKVVGFYGVVVDLWARYGFGLGPYQEDGVSITALAATPTS